MTERLLKMPRLGETMDEGKIVGWLIKPGDSFSRGDPIIEIETDKTVAEFPALGNGKLTEILVDLDQTIEVGTPIARVELVRGRTGHGKRGESPRRSLLQPPVWRWICPCHALAKPWRRASFQMVEATGRTLCAWRSHR